MAVVELPLQSINFQVTTVVPCVVIGKTVAVVPVMVPEQRSLVVGTTGVPLHSPTVTSTRVGVTGAVVSFTVIT